MSCHSPSFTRWCGWPSCVVVWARSLLGVDPKSLRSSSTTVEGRPGGLVSGHSPSFTRWSGWPSCVVILGQESSWRRSPVVAVVLHCGGKAPWPGRRSQPFVHPPVRLAVVELARLALSVVINLISSRKVRRKFLSSHLGQSKSQVEWDLTKSNGEGSALQTSLSRRGSEKRLGMLPDLVHDE